MAEGCARETLVLSKRRDNGVPVLRRFIIDIFHTCLRVLPPPTFLRGLRAPSSFVEGEERGAWVYRGGFRLGLSISHDSRSSVGT